MRIEIKNPNIVVKASNPSIVIRISGVPTVPGNPIPTADNDFIIGTALGVWLKKTLAQVKTILGLGSAAYTASGDYAASVHTHIDKVDKVTGSSLLADTELAILKNEILGIACSDETTNLTTGEKIAFDMPFSCVLTRVYGTLKTAATGNTLTVDVKDEGTSILNAVLGIADGANNGETSTFAAAAVSYTFTKGDLLSIDVAQIGSTAAGKGLIIFLEGYRT